MKVTTRLTLLVCLLTVVCRAAALSPEKPNPGEELERAGHRAEARLIVEVTPENAKITLDRAVLPESEARRSYLIALDPAHDRETLKIAAELPEHASRSVEVELVRGQETRVSIVLSPANGLLSSPWFWAGSAAAVAVAIAGGVAIAGALRPGFQGPCQSRRGDPCP